MRGQAPRAQLTTQIRPMRSLAASPKALSSCRPDPNLHHDTPRSRAALQDGRRRGTIELISLSSTRSRADATLCRSPHADGPARCVSGCVAHASATRSPRPRESQPARSDASRSACSDSGPCCLAAARLGSVDAADAESGRESAASGLGAAEPLGDQLPRRAAGRRRLVVVRCPYCTLLRRSGRPTTRTWSWSSACWLCPRILSALSTAGAYACPCPVSRTPR